MQTFTEKLKFLQARFGTYSLSRNGLDVSFRCPNPDCSSRRKQGKKKLVINLKSDLYHCWVCGVKGKNLSFFLGKYLGKQDSNEYKKIFGGEDLLHIEQENEETILRLPKGFKLLYYDLDTNFPDVKSIHRYLISRNVSKRDLLYFKMGTSTDFDFRRRIVIPSFDAEGKLNYYVARAIDEEKRNYINAPGDKMAIIFNEMNIDWSKELTIVEGPFDLFKVNENATCLLGSTLNEKSLLFKKIVQNSTPVVLSLDKDAQRKSSLIAKRLMSYGISVKMLTIDEFEDIGSMTKEQFNDAKDKSTINWDTRKDILSKISRINSGSIL